MKESAVESATPEPLRLFYKWLCLCTLVLQNSIHILVMRYTRTVEQAGPRYVGSTAVFLSELLKLVGSLLLLCFEAGSVRGGFGAAKESLFDNPSELLRVSVPSLLYAVQNNLQLVSLSNLSCAVHQVMLQLKILHTALLSVVFLGRQLGVRKWASLVLLTVAVALLQVPRGGDADSPTTTLSPVAGAEEGGPSFAKGMAAVLSIGLLSGMSSVYLEAVMKQRPASIWRLNLQLAATGAPVTLLVAMVQDGKRLQEGGFFQGYTPLVYFMVTMTAGGGFVVAGVMRYADSILKCFATSLSIVLTCCVSVLLLEEVLVDLHFVMGTALVMLSTIFYSLGCPPAGTMLSAPAAREVKTVDKQLMTCG